MATRRALTAAQAVTRAEGFPLDLLRFNRATIVGPMASLHRYSVAAEKTLLGDYDKVDDTQYEWPGLNDEIPDIEYAKIYLENARLNYFNKYIGLNGSAVPSSTYPNRVRASNYVFKTGNANDRSSAFYDRDVAIGDVVILRAVVDSEQITHTTTVTGFVGETVAATRGAATADASNQSNQSLSVTATQVVGTPVNDIEVTASAASYSSLDDGGVNRVYTVTVTQSSTDGDATTGRLRVRSSDGLDDEDDVVPAAFGAATSIGTKGLTGTFSINPSASSGSLFGLDEDDFIIGQQWTFTVAQAFTAPTATSAGTYTGPVDLTYIVTVSTGATLASGDAEITVTSSNGRDRSGPTAVTAAATAIAVGNYGVTISFAGSALCAGDIYTIAVTAETEGALKTLVLNDNVPEELQGEEVDLRLFIPKTGIELARVRSLPSNAVNWTPTADEITVESEIYLTDSTLTDNGELVPVALESADMYIHYRSWVEEGGGTIVRISSLADVADALGTADPDNPIAYAVDRALRNTASELLRIPKITASANTDIVVALPIGGDPSTIALWEDALNALEGEEDASQIVVLSDSPAVFDLVKAHIEAQSDDSEGYYRRAWITAQVEQTEALVDEATTTDEEIALATVTATPATSPTKYTTLTCTSANGQFTTKGVRAGDEVRISYDEDLLGNEVYDSYTVASVTSQNTLILETGPTAAISVAVKFEVWRTHTKSEYAQRIREFAEDYKTETGRINVIWPKTVEIDSVSVPGSFLAAAVAGLAGSVPSHQNLAGVGIEGITTVAQSNPFFRPAQLNDLADGGVFVISADRDGNVFVRNANTPDTESTNTRLEMVVRNSDMVRYGLKDSFSEITGVTNITDALDPIMIDKVRALEARLKVAAVGQELGVPIAALVFSSSSAVVGQDDARSVSVAMRGPVPFNTLVLNLQVSTQNA